MSYAYLLSIYICFVISFRIFRNKLYLMFLVIEYSQRSLFEAVHGVLFPKKSLWYSGILSWAKLLAQVVQDEHQLQSSKDLNMWV